MKKYIKAPEIKVGILHAPEISVKLNGKFAGQSLTGITGDLKFYFSNGKVKVVSSETDFTSDEILLQPESFESCFFTVFDVIIGIGFHWQKNEDQVFRGNLKVIPVANGIRLINIISVEGYLVSVISSEMKATSSAGLLKAHAVISRSWLLAQIEKQNDITGADKEYRTSFVTDSEITRWYDREDHVGFDVCADDHCQRYQGITRAFTNEASLAVNDTSGKVLVFNDRLCDARFSKCCGGITELFENTWEPVSHPYLKRIYDMEGNSNDNAGDLSMEDNAKSWILSKPPAFCNTGDKEILAQVLNDYDLTTQNFYRWTVTYSREEISELIRNKTGIDFGDITDLSPVERGVSGRLVKLRITGTKKSMVIGKELEIRKALSPTHLYSSAFVPQKVVNDGRESFVLKGAGWGHGVGLCQIGAAVMGSKGYKYDEILKHYFRGADLIKLY